MAKEPAGKAAIRSAIRRMLLFTSLRFSWRANPFIAAYHGTSGMNKAKREEKKNYADMSWEISMIMLDLKFIRGSSTFETLFEAQARISRISLLSK